MQVILKKIASGYRASSYSPFVEVAEGPTREDALHLLQNLLHKRLDGGEIVELPLNGTVTTREVQRHRLADFAGDMKDSPLYDDWVDSMKEYRRQVEEDPNYL